MTMRRLSRKGIGALARDTRGATAIEYALIAMLVGVAAIIAIAGLGGKVRGLWQDVATKIEDTAA